jgi:hypothetical protein
LRAQNAAGDSAQYRADDLAIACHPARCRYFFVVGIIPNDWAIDRIDCTTRKYTAAISLLLNLLLARARVEVVLVFAPVTVDGA